MPPPLRLEENGRVFKSKFGEADQMPTKRQLGQRLSLRLLEEHFLRHDVETNVMSDSTLLANLTQRVMRCITITWRPSSSVNFYILILFSETTTPIGTNLVGMFNRWSPTQFMFHADRKYTKETRGTKSINYLLYICF